MVTIFQSKFFKKCILGVFITVFLLLSGFIIFLEDMKSEDMWTKEIASNEVIVVLTGGSGRVSKGLELLKTNEGSIMIISGVNRDAGMSSIFANYNLGDLKGRIFLEKESKSTYENAIEVSDMIETFSVLRERKVEYITLVTSPYHMYRASYTFRTLFSSNIEINKHPTVGRGEFIEDWHRGGGLFSAFKEYLKMYVYYVRCFFH